MLSSSALSDFVSPTTLCTSTPFNSSSSAVKVPLLGVCTRDDFGSVSAAEETLMQTFGCDEDNSSSLDG